MNGDPMLADIEHAVRREIEGLHTFFVGWFSGVLAKNAFECEFLQRFDPEFLLIPPAGTLLTLGELATAVRDRHSSNPDFRIAIRNVTVRRLLEDQVIATYEEWQRNALASKPPENARLASVVFQRGERLRWLHVHETWLPSDIASAGPYDF
jgi:hypothetical protein